MCWVCAPGLCVQESKETTEAPTVLPLRRAGYSKPSDRKLKEAVKPSGWRLAVRAGIKRWKPQHIVFP